MPFGAVQEVDHQFADVMIEIVILQGGERQEARAGDNVNTVGGTTEADEGGCHFPFSGWIEEGKLTIGFDVMRCEDEHASGVEQNGWVA